MGVLPPNPTIFQEQLCHSVCIFVGNGVKNSIVWYSCMKAVMKVVVAEVAAKADTYVYFAQCVI